MPPKRLSAPDAVRQPNCDHLAFAGSAAAGDGYDLRNLPMYMRSISINQSDIALSTSNRPAGRSLVPHTQIRDPHC